MRTIPTLTPFVQQVLDRYEAHAPIAFAVRLSLEHTFAEKGRHIVHVLLNKSYAFTYTVTVK